jgi:predicted nucleic acid-binding Zn ribbon protein
MRTRRLAIADKPKNDCCKTCGYAAPAGSEQFTAHNCQDVLKLREARRRESVGYDMGQWITGGEKAIADFKQSLDRDAAYAMEWSDSLFQATARKHVAEGALQLLKNVEADPMFALAAMPKLERWATENALRGARNPQRSTSAASNAMAQAKTEAFAELAEKLDRRWVVA